MKLKIMRRSFLILVLILPIFAAMLSCQSAPPQEVPQAAVTTPPSTPPAVNPETAPPGQADLSALEAAAARAEAARKMAIEFDAPLLLPSDWESANSLYTQAEQGKRTSTVRETQDSTTRYNIAADALEKLSDGCIAQYYESMQKEVLDAREAAVSAGALGLIPDFLWQADDSVDLALEKYQAKDYLAAKEAVEEGVYLYNSLKVGLDAYKIREELVDREFLQYAQTDIELGDDALESAASYYTSRYYPAARENADQALQHYSSALLTAWGAYASERSAIVSTARQRALDVKADVAANLEFSIADDMLNQANVDLRGQNYEEAVQRYLESEVMFTASAETAREKQRRAEEALRRANERVAESDAIARTAEAILGGGAE